LILIDRSIFATMHSCPELTPPTAEFIARDAEYSYDIFDGCFPAGSGVYAPKANDSFALDTKNEWSWNDAPTADRTLLRKRQTGILTVHPDNGPPSSSTATPSAAPRSAGSSRSTP
jgi:hypothetical protein